MARKQSESWRLRPEILKGKLDDAVFGVDFQQVLEGTGPAVYADPKLFEKNTYPTQGLQTIAREVFGRLADPNEAGLSLRLSTGFGGGKTHTLITLLHLARNITKSTYATEILPAAGRPGKVSVAAIDVGKASDPDFAEHGKVKTHSLWGEIAYQLHGNRLPRELAEIDSPDRDPNAAQMKRIFPDGPVLVLLDEPVKYMAALDERRKARLLKFLDSFVSAVEQRPQTVFVITDPGDQPAYAAPASELAKWLSAAKSLKEVLSRKGRNEDPIGNETANVIRRRLFEWVDEKKAAQVVSSEYIDAYKRVMAEHPGMLPSDAVTAAYAERIVQCYPFHPRFIDTLQGRLAGMENFQRSRGVLRLLAKVLRDLHERGVQPKLITAADVNWLNPAIQSELLDRLGKPQFKSAIEYDLVKHAGMLDDGKENGIHRRVAGALLLESLPDNSEGFSPQDATLAVLGPDDAGPEPADALDALSRVAWFIHETPGGRWRFQYEANINRMIEERMGKIAPEDAATRVRAEAQKFYAAPPIFRPAFWPQTPRDVRDDTVLQLVVCDSVERAHRVLASSDDTDPQNPQPRQFRNAIFAVCPTETAFAEAVERYRRMMAAEEVENDLVRASDKAALEQLKRVKPELAKLARVQMRRAMSQLVLYDGAVHNLPEEMLAPDEGRELASPSGQTGLQKYLIEKKHLYRDDENLDPVKFTRDILPGAAPLLDNRYQGPVYTTLAIKERMYSAPGLRLIPGDKFIKNTIRAAVEAGRIVVFAADGRAWHQHGCVAGEPGRRRQVSEFLDLSRLTLDKTTLVTPADSDAAKDWLRVDATKGSPGKPVPAPPAPPGAPKDDDQLTADDWDTAITLARRKSLVNLEIEVRLPADHATLVTLLPPLGAENTTTETRVDANLKGGGQAKVYFSGVKLQNPLKAQEIVERVIRAAEGEPEYRCIFTLNFGAGRAGMADALKALRDTSPENVRVHAEFA